MPLFQANVFDCPAMRCMLYTKGVGFLNNARNVPSERLETRDCTEQKHKTWNHEVEKIEPTYLPSSVASPAHRSLVAVELWMLAACV